MKKLIKLAFNGVMRIIKKIYKRSSFFIRIVLNKPNIYDIECLVNKEETNIRNMKFYEKKALDNFYENKFKNGEVSIAEIIKLKKKKENGEYLKDYELKALNKFEEENEIDLEKFRNLLKEVNNNFKNLKVSHLREDLFRWKD
jgi:hypothetical protein